MIQQSTTLIIQPEDFTPDGNLRKEAYDALKTASIVIDGTDVIKNSITGLITQKTPAKRVRASSTPPKTETPPQPQAGDEAPRPSEEDNNRTGRTPAALPQEEQAPPEAGPEA